ncbi:hypothetical protein JTB14_009293 [Gonioctena quinquepunctata]|nr:hypothetical protein JTB14_009293 [Gonioctena quinquepunctata]
MDSYEKKAFVKDIKHKDEISTTNLASSSKEFVESEDVLEGAPQKAKGSHSCLKSSMEKIETVKEDIIK